MRITKILMKNMGDSLFYSHPENMTQEDENFRIGFSVNQLSEKEKLHFGSDHVSSYHLPMVNLEFGVLKQVRHFPARSMNRWN